MLVKNNSIKNGNSIAFFPNNNIVYYKEGKVYQYVYKKNTHEEILDLNFPKKIILLERVKLFKRFFRFGLRSKVAISENIFLLGFKNVFYEVDIKAKKCINISSLELNNKPIYLSNISNINNFKNGVYCGGYIGNLSMNKVSIYFYNNNQWKKVYTFKEGNINHIHNIVEDRFNSCLWILTGDFGKGACIWQAKNNFEIVNPIFRNEQIYRGCFAKAVDGGLLYLTDTPFQQNYLRFLYRENNIWKSKSLRKIEGSVIYGENIGEDCIFSTTVEGNGTNINYYTKLFGRKRGDGILDRNVYIYLGNVHTGFKTIAKFKKDIYPFIPFQFGLVQFPIYFNHKKEFLVLDFQATRRYDKDIVLMKYKEHV